MHEQTVTIEVDGSYFNVPSIVGGKKVSPTAAFDHAVKTGTAGVPFDSIEQAVAAAKRRSRVEGGTWPPVPKAKPEVPLSATNSGLQGNTEVLKSLLALGQQGATINRNPKMRRVVAGEYWPMSDQIDINRSDLAYPDHETLRHELMHRALTQTGNIASTLPNPDAHGSGSKEAYDDLLGRTDKNVDRAIREEQAPATAQAIPEEFLVRIMDVMNAPTPERRGKLYGNMPFSFGPANVIDARNQAHRLDALAKAILGSSAGGYRPPPPPPITARAALMHE